MKVNISLGVCLMLLLTSMVAVTTADTYDPQAGPNYWGFSSSSQHRNINVGGTFTTPLWVNVHQSIDTASADNMTFLPTGIIDYTSTDVGNLFASYLVFLDPEGSGTIDNVNGYAKPITGASITAVNNTNATLATITWTIRNCGAVTLSITEGGTARLGGDIGADEIPYTLYIHPLAVTGFTATKQGSSQINLGWTKQTGDTKTLVRYRADTYPTSVTDGTELYNNTGSSTSLSGLSPGDTRYFSAWGWNESGHIYSQNAATAYAMTNRVPQVGVPTPVNNSINQPRSLSWSVPITDPDGDSISWTIQCSNGQQTSGAGGGGTKALSIGGLAYSTTYTVWVNASDATDTTRRWFQFTTLANIAPVQGTPSPTNGSTGRAFAFTWSIPITDGNGDTLTGTIQCSNGQSAVISGTNGTKSLPLSGLAQLTWYTVYVNVSDGTVWVRRWYNFQTMDNTPPAFGTPTPTNNSINQNLALTWSIGMTDAESDTISWTLQCSNGQSNSGAGSTGLTATLSLSNLAYSTTYRVYVNATDAGGSGTYTRRWYQFTTKANQPPSTPTGKIPNENAKDVDPDIGRLMLIVSDPDGHSLTVRFYWGNGTLIGTDAGVVSGQFAEIAIPDLLENTDYFWYVNITDGYGGYRRGPTAGSWKFTTGEYSKGNPHEGGASQNDVIIAVLHGIAPVPGALITINQGSSVQTMGVEVVVATTGPEGIYNFNLANGNYILTITAPGMVKYQALLSVEGDTSSVAYLQQSGGEFPWWILIIGLIASLLVLFLYRTDRLGHRRKY